MNENKMTPVVQFSGFMDKMKSQMALALPKHLSVDRMARLALTAFSTNPALQKCTYNSIAASIMTAVQLGLEPNVNGAGYLIPYKETCTFVPGWKGLVDLVGRSGRGTVFTGVIFEDQVPGVDWEFFDGSRRELIIRKQSSLIDETKITHAYAVGWAKDASIPIIELWSVDKLEAHRNRHNKVGKSHYSFKYWEMYCRKIPLLQVIKYMPCSIELAMALDVVNVTEFGGVANIENGVVLTDDKFNDEQEEEPVTLPECSEETFKKNQNAWFNLVDSGKKTAENLIVWLSAKYTLTEQQQMTIESWENVSD